MSLEITGKLIVKGDSQQVSEKFKKREFVLELAEEINGNIYTNFAKMQLVQNKCDILDRYGIGATVTCSFNIKGNSYVDKKDGTTKYITNLDCWKIEGSGTATPTPSVTGNDWTAPPQTFVPPSNDTIDDLPF